MVEMRAVFHHFVTNGLFYCMSHVIYNILNIITLLFVAAPSSSGAS